MARPMLVLAHDLARTHTALLAGRCAGRGGVPVIEATAHARLFSSGSCHWAQRAGAGAKLCQRALFG